jgi:hypothetical protein
MTAAQRRRARQMLQVIEERTRDSWQIALATPVLEPAELSALCRADTQAAATFLAGLDERQLWVEAIACASWVNDYYGYGPDESVQAEDLFAKFHQMMCKAVPAVGTSELEHSPKGAEAMSDVTTVSIELPIELPIPQQLDTLERHIITSTDLGAGLHQEAAIYTYQEANRPVECFGHCVAFRYHDLTIEMETVFVDHRKVGMLQGDSADHLFSAAEWVQIAELVRRDEVFAALQQWAAEDALRVC